MAENPPIFIKAKKNPQGSKIQISPQESKLPRMFPRWMAKHMWRKVILMVVLGYAVLADSNKILFLMWIFMNKKQKKKS